MAPNYDFLGKPHSSFLARLLNLFFYKGLNHYESVLSEEVPPVVSIRVKESGQGTAVRVTGRKCGTGFRLDRTWKDPWLSPRAWLSALSSTEKNMGGEESNWRGT